MKQTTQRMIRQPDLQLTWGEKLARYAQDPRMNDSCPRCSKVCQCIVAWQDRSAEYRARILHALDTDGELPT